jgi:putative Holliday junction resolvase
VTRLLALDVGERRIGVAVADSTTGMVRPLVALRRRTPGADTRSLAALIAEQRIDELVVGLPLELRGGEGEQVARTRQWVTQVLAPLGRPVSWRDERLTSVVAARPRRRHVVPGGRASIARRRPSSPRPSWTLARAADEFG